MKRSFLIGVIAMAMPFMAGAQTNAPATTAPLTLTITLPDPGLVPGDFFYFLDRWSEGLGNVFTFKAESKAIRALKHAQERASEVHVVLIEKGLSAPEVAEAKRYFEKELNYATAIISGEKTKGVDVSGFIMDVDDEFELAKDMLKEAYRGYRSNLKEVEKDLNEKLREAIKAGDTAVQAAIEAELNRLDDESFSTIDEEDSVDDLFEEEKQHLESALGEERAAESHIMNAERAQADLLRQATVRGITVSESILTAFDEMMLEAQSAMTDGDFETAKEYAKDAKELLNDARQDLNAKEDERDFSHRNKEKNDDEKLFDFGDLEDEISDIEEMSTE